MASGLLERVKRRLRATKARLDRHSWFRIVWNSFQGLSDHQATRLAAAMTYFALFSIFPSILLLIALLSFLVDARQAQAEAISLLSYFLPGGPTGVERLIEGVIAARGTAAGFGIVTLLWSAISWFENVDRSVNDLWGVHVTRPFAKGKLFALAMALGMALVMMLSWLMNIAVGFGRGLTASLGIDQLPGAAGLWDLAAALIAFGLIFVIFLLLYRFSPMCQLHVSDVWRGALITAIAWEVVRSSFALYVTNFANYSSLYGPLAAVIAFLVWLYVAHLIILLGAELTYTMRLESEGIHHLRGLPCGVAGRGKKRAGGQGG